jgi:hypothetical protein
VGIVGWGGGVLELAIFVIIKEKNEEMIQIFDKQIRWGKNDKGKN